MLVDSLDLCMKRPEGVRGTSLELFELNVAVCDPQNDPEKQKTMLHIVT